MIVLIVAGIWACAFVGFLGLWALFHGIRPRPIPHDDPRPGDELSQLAVAPEEVTR